MERMLCIYFMPRYLCLSDPTMGDALYDSESMWRYAAIELVEGATPDDSRILRFPHLIDRYGIIEQLLELMLRILTREPGDVDLGDDRGCGRPSMRRHRSRARTGLKIRRESTIRGTLSSGALRCR
jgi:IS5 family transposase